MEMSRSLGNGIPEALGQNRGNIKRCLEKYIEKGRRVMKLSIKERSKDKFNVSVENGRVMVTGEAPTVSHDSGGRLYSGDVAMLSSAVSILIRKIKTIAKNGVIRLIIPPV